MPQAHDRNVARDRLRVGRHDRRAPPAAHRAALHPAGRTRRHPPSRAPARRRRPPRSARPPPRAAAQACRGRTARPAVPADRAAAAASPDWHPERSSWASSTGQPDKPGQHQSAQAQSTIRRRRTPATRCARRTRTRCFSTAIGSRPRLLSGLGSVATSLDGHVVARRSFEVDRRQGATWLRSEEDGGHRLDGASPRRAGARVNDLVDVTITPSTAGPRALARATCAPSSLFRGRRGVRASTCVTCARSTFASASARPIAAATPGPVEAAGRAMSIRVRRVALARPR